MTKTKKEKSRDMTSIKEKIKYIANIRLIFESKQILSLDRIKTSKGITLIALVITILFSYDEKLKCSNSKGFLLATI